MQELRQQLRMRQELTLQPQQILRSELIQMAALELELRVKAELEENPFLEQIDPVEEEGVSEDESRESAAVKDDSSEDEKPEPDTVAETHEVDWDDFLSDADHWEYRRSLPRQQSVDLSVELPQPQVPTQAENLYDQLHLESFSDDEMRIGEEIIGNLDHDGYLETTLEEIAESTGMPLEMVERVHHRILFYDPVGIAARNLRECLLAQLSRRDPPAPIPERMLTEFWDDFVNKRFEILAEKMELEPEEIKDAFEVISHLNPKPGEGNFDEKTNYVLPDLVVTRVGDEFEVFLQDGDIPNFRINQAYREMFIKRSQSDKQVKDFLVRKMESARWFVNAIHQRRTTMIRAMRAIVDRQKEFFLRGPAHLKPMILADIALDIGMDISTISRVTNGKWVQTDWGIFELKYFFTERMETDEGEDVSNRVIKGRLKEIIDAENKKKPLSDQELTDILNGEGFQIKRRTVAKYRELLRIPIKRLRREI